MNRFEGERYCEGGWSAQFVENQTGTDLIIFRANLGHEIAVPVRLVELALDDKWARDSLARSARKNAISV